MPNPAPLHDIRLKNLSDLELTLQGYSTSNVMVLLDSPYAISYWCLIINTWHELAPLRDINRPNLSDVDIDFQGH